MLKGRPFSIYDRLANIFGKDRATGIGAQISFDMIEDLNMEIENELETNWGIPNTLIFLMSVNQPVHSEHTMLSQSSCKKRAKSKDDLVKGFSEVASKLFKQLTEKFDKSEANYPKYLAELAEKKRQNGKSDLHVLEAMLVEVNASSWIIDSEVSNHVCSPL